MFSHQYVRRLVGPNVKQGGPRATCRSTLNQNTLRHMAGEGPITHLGLDYYEK